MLEKRMMSPGQARSCLIHEDRRRRSDMEHVKTYQEWSCFTKGKVCLKHAETTSLNTDKLCNERCDTEYDESATCIHRSPSFRTAIFTLRNETEYFCCYFILTEIQDQGCPTPTLYSRQAARKLQTISVQQTRWLQYYTYHITDQVTDKYLVYRRSGDLNYKQLAYRRWGDYNTTNNYYIAG
jgi:hypothetical protein